MPVCLLCKEMQVQQAVQGADRKGKCRMRLASKSKFCLFPTPFKSTGKAGEPAHITGSDRAISKLWSGMQLTCHKCCCTPPKSVVPTCQPVAGRQRKLLFDPLRLSSSSGSSSSRRSSSTAL